MSVYIGAEITIGNETIHINKNSEYRILAGGLEGVESPPMRPTVTEYAAIDGGFVEGIKVEPRVITLRFAIQNRRQTEALRKKLIAFFKPNSTGTLVVERSGRRRKIAFVLYNSVGFVQDNVNLDRLYVTVNMLCPDPYFEDEEPTTYKFMQVTGLLTFPFNSLEGVGITAGTLLTTDTMRLVNSGDRPVGIVCEINAYGGSVTNPQIAMNGKYVKVLYDLSLGQTATIDTRQGEKNIYIDGETRFIFERQSVFFQLPVGESDIVITADAGIEDAKAQFTYSFKYLGV